MIDLTKSYSKYDNARIEALDDGLTAALDKQHSNAGKLSARAREATGIQAPQALVF